jgi:hypothetical protein
VAICPASFLGSQLYSIGSWVVLVLALCCFYDYTFAVCFETRSCDALGFFFLCGSLVLTYGFKDYSFPYFWERCQWSLHPSTLTPSDPGAQDISPLYVFSPPVISVL